MAIAPSKLGEFLVEEGFSWPTSRLDISADWRAGDERIVHRLREIGLVRPDAADDEVMATFQAARDEHIGGGCSSYNSPHERVRVFLGPYLTQKGRQWAEPLKPPARPDVDPGPYVTLAWSVAPTPPRLRRDRQRQAFVTPNYRHTQVGRLTICLLGVAVAVAVGSSAGAGQPAPVLIALLLGGVLVLFCTLTVVVRDEVVDIFFGPGLIRRRIHLCDIRSVRVVRNPWYYGWGIRLTPHGWLWNVSGLGAVEIQFADGRRFRIGSDEPDRLAAALRLAAPSA